MGARNLFVANSPLALLEAAAVARRQGGRAHLLLLEDFELAERLARLLKRWRDNPFEAITRLRGRYEQELRFGAGAQRGIAAFARRIATQGEIHRETLGLLREIDARFEPTAVWVGNDQRLEAQYALHLASLRTATRAGRYLDEGLQGYLGPVRRRPLARRVDELVQRLGHGRWAKRVRQVGTSPWILEGWLAFPDEAVDQDPARLRHALPREWFGGRDFRRLWLLAAREFGLKREALAGFSAVLALPHSKLLRTDAAAQLRLRRLMEAAEACGRRIALKHHPREHEADPAGLLAEGAALALPRPMPLELLLPLLPRASLLAGEASTALLAARWLRPDLVVCELGSGRGETGARARALFARHGIGPLDETALS